MGKLTFGSKKKRVNYELLRVSLVWALRVAIVCFIAFVCVWYFGFKVSMIGDSMQPRLCNGDTTLLNRLVYDMSAPKRGDVVAFRPNGNENSHYYIKRVIGLPGETVELRDGEIYINNKKIKEKYKTTEIEEAGLLKEPITLAKNEFFVLGDDRQNSEDSRMPDVGNVKRSEIAGKIWFVVSPAGRWGFVK